MARICSEEAVHAIGNRYDLILVAARRARELSRGDAPKVNKITSTGVTALREIEQGHIGRDYLFKAQDLKDRPQRRKY